MRPLLLLQMVSKKEYSDWSALRQSALAAMENREELIRDSAVYLERELTLLGNSSQCQTCMSVPA